MAKKQKPETTGERSHTVLIQDPEGHTVKMGLTGPEAMGLRRYLVRLRRKPTATKPEIRDPAISIPGGAEMLAELRKMR